MVTAAKAKAKAPRAKARARTGGIAWARDIARKWAALGGDPYSVFALHRLQADACCTAAEISEGGGLKAEAVTRSFKLLSRLKLAHAKGAGMHPAYELTDEGRHYAAFVAARAGTV